MSDEKPKVVLGICVPVRDRVHTGFAYDLARLTGTLGTGLVAEGKIELHVLFMQDIVHSGRQKLVMRAVQKGCTHLLWLDSDMRFPADVFHRLWNRGKRVVGINYSTRNPPDLKPVTHKFIPAPQEMPVRCYTLPDSEGIEKVEALGFGAVLMDIGVFADTQLPWFEFAWAPERKGYIGEDVYFCQKLKDAGIDVYVDHDLSKLCAHIGEQEFTVEDAAMCINPEQLVEVVKPAIQVVEK